VFGLDSLRAIAITCVLLSHARFFLVPLAPDIARFRLLGFLGVELFFVLSGFLIGGLLLDQGDALPSARGWAGSGIGAGCGRSPTMRCSLR